MTTFLLVIKQAGTEIDNGQWSATFMISTEETGASKLFDITNTYYSDLVEIATGEENLYDAAKRIGAFLRKKIPCAIVVSPIFALGVAVSMKTS